MEGGSNGHQNDTFMDSKDFSLSSLISDLSQRLGSNSSSSFLMHVDEEDIQDRRSRRVSALPSGFGLDDERYAEILRRMSIEEGGVGRGGMSSIFPQSFVRSNVVEEEEEEGKENESQVTEVDEAADSWDEFDQVMEKSMGAADWGRVDLDMVGLTQGSSVRSAIPTPEGTFMSAKDALMELDKEEEERAQFCKSVNNSFPFSPAMCSSLLMDPTNVSQYFMRRSSFPVDNRANESTMFEPGGISQMMRIDEEQESNATEERTLTPRNSTIRTDSLTPVQRYKMEHGSPLSGIPTPESAKEIANHILAAPAIAKEEEREGFIDFILNQCRQSMGNKQTATITTTVPSPPTKLAAPSKITQTQRDSGKGRGLRLSNPITPILRTGGANQSQTEIHSAEPAARVQGQTKSQEQSASEIKNTTTATEERQQRPSLPVPKPAEQYSSFTKPSSVSVLKPAHRDSFTSNSKLSTARPRTATAATNTTPSAPEKQPKACFKEASKMKRPTPVYPHHNAPPYYGHHGPLAIGGPTPKNPNVEVHNYYYFPPGQPVHIHTHHGAGAPQPEPNQQQQQAQRHHRPRRPPSAFAPTTSNPHPTPPPTDEDD